MNPLTRRDLMRGAAAARGLLLTGCNGPLLPPTYGSLLGVGEALTFASHRLLLPGRSLAREFSRDMISVNFPAINTIAPEDEEYQRLRHGGFADWRLPVGGLVRQPVALSLADLQRMQVRTQITQHNCEQGWSAIAEWTGVPLRRVLEHVGLAPAARYIVFHCTDGWWDSLDMADALHPQTLLAYGMNGSNLPVPHGAPVRLRVERQLGYKNLKYLSTITVTDSAAEWGEGKGSQGAEHGYSWYAGI